MNGFVRGSEFVHEHHRRIAKLLSALDTDLLCRSGCWFGGGTAIVLLHDEYRVSNDVDFLCADEDGYRTLRETTFRGGIANVFEGRVKELRETRRDRYGIRTVIEVDGVPIRFEIVNENRIPLSGAVDPGLSVPVLDVASQMAEKLLANADRGMDAATARRDAVDLGILLATHGPLPTDAVARVERAYGAEVGAAAHRTATMLGTEARPTIARTLGMTIENVDRAATAFVAEAHRVWPVPGGGQGESS